MEKGTKECRLWHDMMYRTNYKYVKKNQSYIGSTVAERWLSFENFYLDIVTMTGFNEFDELNKPFALDKDLFGKGSKIYSKDNCVFIPHSINKFLANIYKKKGELPPGVVFHKVDKKYQSQISIDGKRKYLGQFNSPQQAYEVYCKARNQYARDLGERYKHKVDKRVYDALMTYNEVWFDVLRLPSC